MPESRRGAFLTAEWRQLAMLNYEVAAGVLLPHLPRGTELDDLDGRHFVSVVGFLFLRTRVLGIPVPFHRRFAEVNLRFYVRRRDRGEVRHGVTFVRELVPRRLITAGARLTFNEPYCTRRMRHRLAPIDRHTQAPASVEYAWRDGGRWNAVSVVPAGAGLLPPHGSAEEYLTARHWGYTPQRDGSTVEYQVEHPRWRVWHAGEARLTGALDARLDPGLAGVLAGTPASAWLADGSAVTVRRPTRIS